MLGCIVLNQNNRLLTHLSSIISDTRVMYGTLSRYAVLPAVPNMEFDRESIALITNVRNDMLISARQMLYVGGSDTEYDPISYLENNGIIQDRFSSLPCIFEETSWLYFVNGVRTNSFGASLLIQAVNTPVHIAFVYYHGSHNIIWYTGECPLVTGQDVLVHHITTMNRQSFALTPGYLLTKYRGWSSTMRRNTFLLLSALSNYICRKIT